MITSTYSKDLIVLEVTFTKNLSRHHSNDFEYLVDTNNYNT